MIKKLDAEGDLAADYLEELLDIADLDGDIEISVEAERAAVAVVTDGPADRRLKRLIGRNGEVLESLQELTRLAVQSKTDSPFMRTVAIASRAIAAISARCASR